MKGLRSRGAAIRLRPLAVIVGDAVPGVLPDRGKTVTFKGFWGRCTGDDCPDLQLDEIDLDNEVGCLVQPVVVHSLARHCRLEGDEVPEVRVKGSVSSLSTGEVRLFGDSHGIGD